VTIPVNSDAKVVVPKDIYMTDVTVREGDRVVWEKGHFVPGTPGISAATARGDEFTFDVGSGHYSFKLTGE
jgi:hypothetical protein